MGQTTLHDSSNPHNTIWVRSTWILFSALTQPSMIQSSPHVNLLIPPLFIQYDTAQIC